MSDERLAGPPRGSVDAVREMVATVRADLEQLARTPLPEHYDRLVSAHEMVRAALDEGSTDSDHRGEYAAP